MEYLIGLGLGVAVYVIAYNTGVGHEHRRIQRGRLEFVEALNKKRDETVIHW